MKKFILILLITIVMSISFSQSFAYSPQVLLDSQSRKYTTIDSSLYKINYPEYDSIEVMNISSGKKHTFYLDVDVLELLGIYYYNSDVINDMTTKNKKSS